MCNLVTFAEFLRKRLVSAVFKLFPVIFAAHVALFNIRLATDKHFKWNVVSHLGKGQNNPETAAHLPHLPGCSFFTQICLDFI